MGRAKNPRIKRANQLTEFTPHQIQELKRCAQDPIYFTNKYVRIQHPTRGAIPFKMYDYQIEMMEAYQQNRYNIVLSARQTGKALSLDTPIPTPSGWTTMGDIQPDDFVLDANGLPVQVEAISDVMFDHNCYKVIFDTGDCVTADGGHLWEVKDEYTRKVKILTTQQMVDTNYVNEKNQARYTVKTSKAVILPEQELDVDPYTLGVWLGDGTSRAGEITTHINDLELYEYVDQQYETYQRLDSNKNKNVYRTTLYGLRTNLQKYGLIQNKHIPIIYKRSSFDQRLRLLQGLMDTDGTVDGLGRGGCDITLANKILAEDVYELISSLGLKPSFKERYVKGFVRYEIRFSAYSNEIEVFRLKRKLNLMKELPHPTRIQSTKKRSIQKIKKVKSVPVKCIRINNDDHLFLFGKGFIPTHNSITSAIYLLWFAIFNFDKNILIASNKNKGAMEMIHRIRYAYENLPLWLKPGVTDDGWNKHSVSFDNDSKIDSTATSEDSGRGESLSLLFLDEFAFVKPNIQEEFWTSILPTLSTGGSCIMSSTPNGDADLFATLWRAANVGKGMEFEDEFGNIENLTFTPKHVPWDAPPGRNEKFKQQQIALIGEQKWRQEYLCEFLSSDSLLIDSIVLANLTPIINQTEIVFEHQDVKFWKHILIDGIYLIGIDPATGDGQDFGVINVIEFPAMEQIAEYRSNSMSSTHMYRVLKNIIKYLEKHNATVYFSIENNGVGEGMISLFEADENPPELAELIHEPGKKKRGFTTTKKSKMRCCLSFKEMIEKATLKIRSSILLTEMKTYTRYASAYAAQRGSTDDCISSMLIVMRLLEEISVYEQAAFDTLYAIEDEEWNLDVNFEKIDDDNEDDGILPFIL